MIYQLNPTALPVDENFVLPIDDPSVSETQKIKVSDLLAPADLRRAESVADITGGMGTDPATGLYTPDDTTAGLKTSDFVAAGLDANLFNADKLLDARLTALQASQTKFYPVTVSAAQVKAMLATPVLILPKPGAGLINYVKRIFVKLDFATTAYTLPGAGQFEFVYLTLGKEIITIPSTFLSLAATTKICQLPALTLDTEIATNDDIYLQSSFGGELTLGDSPIILIVEYETLQDFTSAVTPSTNATCLQSLIDSFVNADLTATGNLEITHNLNSSNVMSVVVTNDKGVSVNVAWSLGDETGADILNVITLAIGPIVTTYNYAIIINVC